MVGKEGYKCEIMSDDRQLEQVFMYKYLDYVFDEMKEIDGAV